MGSSLRAGELFANRFEIQRTAGSGGMGTVYRARDQLSGDFVALKLLLGHGTESGENERFAREAQLLSELRHPGIVAHVAHGVTSDGQRFLAMQWLDGEDLAQRLSRQPLSLREAMTLTSRVAQALDFAHQRGIIHRDLKPSNLFLPSGDIERAQILDFGIARRVKSGRAVTRTGMVVGTPEYMAPEQARGARELTPAVDLFSLGCVLYECLSGAPPFVGDDIAAVLVRILFEEPVPIAQRRSGIPRAVSELLSGLLVKDPGQRIGAASEVANTAAQLADLDELPLQPTLLARDKSTPPQSDEEQALLSLVLALSTVATPATLATQDAEGNGATLLSADARGQSKQRELLLSELRALRAEADLLPAGAMVATVPQLASAQDQAALAVRCAILVKELWPEAQVVVVTGRGSRSRGGLTGEVLDRAWQLLGNRDGTQATGSIAQIRIDEVSAGLLESRFEISALKDLPGAYVLGGQRLDPDAGRLLLGKPTPCVGRERELTVLEAVYAECKEELLARAVLVLGPPGLGKSRLRHEFLRRLESRGESVSVLLGRGDPMKTKSVYGLLGEALRQRFEIKPGQSLDEQRTRIRQRLNAGLPASDALRVTVFIGELCGVPFSDDESSQLRAARQDPRIMSDQVEQAWLTSLSLFRASGPLLLILEDLHWSDALSVKLVDLALRQARDCALMVLALARPEVHGLYPNLWSGAYQALPLHPLPRKAGERLVRQILGSDIAADQIGHLVEQSAGNPLFLEELIRAVAEGRGDVMPETIRAMLLTRLSQLDAGARQILRAASVFGEIFTQSGVAALCGAATGEMLDGALAELTRAEFIESVREDFGARSDSYRFRHALIRDAAYSLFTNENRIAAHRLAISYLEKAGGTAPAVLAEHAQEGQDAARAAHHFIEAAIQAVASHDVNAAQRFAQRALDCGVEGEQLGTVRALQGWAAHVAVNKDLEWGYNQAFEAVSLLKPGSLWWARALEVCFYSSFHVNHTEHLSHHLEMFIEASSAPDARLANLEIGLALSVILGSRGMRTATDRVMQKLTQIAAELPPQDHGVLMLADVWRTYYAEPDAWRIVQGSLRAAELFSAVRDVYSQAMALFCGSMAYTSLGAFSRGEQVMREALSLSAQLGLPFMIHLIEMHLAQVLAKQPAADKRDEARRIACAYLEQKDMGLAWLAEPNAVMAVLETEAGNLDSASVHIQKAIDGFEGLPASRLANMALQVELMLRQGQVAAARQVAEEAHRQLMQQGGLGARELPVRLAVLQARHADGDIDGARRAASDALDAVRLRANFVADLEVRRNFLNTSECSRILELAQLVLGTVEEI